MKKLKLSQLPDVTEIASDSRFGVTTVEELKDEILNDGYEVTGEWFTVKKKEWKPDARWMIESYIENEYDQMYEDWDERAKDCISDDLVSKMQNLLDEAFKGSAVRDYWEWDKDVEIDVEPVNNCIIRP